MRRSRIPSKLVRRYSPRRWRAALMALAAFPLFQATGCFPDLVGALNFEIQSMINRTLITAVDTIVQNVLGL